MVIPGSFHFVKKSKSPVFPSRRDCRHDRIQPSHCFHVEFILSRFHQFTHDVCVIHLLISSFLGEKKACHSGVSCSWKMSLWFRFLGESRLALRDVLNSPNLAASFTISLLDTKRNNTGVRESKKAFTLLLNRSVQVRFSFLTVKKKALCITFLCALKGIIQDIFHYIDYTLIIAHSLYVNGRILCSLFCLTVHLLWM